MKRYINLLYFWNKDELTQEWKESIIVPIHEKGDKLEGFQSCLLNIKFSQKLLSRMTPYTNEIVGEYQCEFRRNKSAVDHIFSIWQTLEKRSGNIIMRYVKILKRPLILLKENPNLIS
jgi:hypothetical protein